MIAGFGLPRQRLIRAKCELFEYQRTRISDGSGGARTHDQRLKRALLYRLSYRPVERARMIPKSPQRGTLAGALYRVGSTTPAAAKPSRRSRQESQRPQAAPAASAW